MRLWICKAERCWARGLCLPEGWEWTSDPERADVIFYCGEGIPPPNLPQGSAGLWWLEVNEAPAGVSWQRVLEALGSDGLVKFTLRMRRGDEERERVLAVSGLRNRSLPNAWKVYRWKRRRVLEVALKWVAQVGAEAWWAQAKPRSSLTRSAAARPRPALWLNGLHRALVTAPRRLFFSSSPLHWQLILAPWQDGKVLWQEMQRIVPPHDRFWADPCLVEWKGERLVFVEEKVYAQGKGRIALLRLDAMGKTIEHTVVLEQPFHLSYPLVFEAEGEWWMVPESAQAGRVDLYRALDFPYRWVREQTLMEGNFVDATPVQFNGRWWLFCAVRDGSGAALEELWLFSAEQLSGPWRPHRANPLWMDIRQARPAGRLFRLNGEWIRPAQDSAMRYGHAVRLQRVLEWTEEVYREETREVLLPVPPFQAMHTFSVAGGWVMLDGWARS